jgi:dTDP-3-amino-3,4,6-trideoxy-alpha-D-glucose transaminase
MTIPFYDLAAEHQNIRSELDEAYRRVMDRGYFILGSELEAFEHEFAAYCGARKAIGVASGLDALKIALLALNVGPGDEVIVAAHTFVATWLAIVELGAKPVPCEPDAGSFSISAAGVAPLITARTRAVIVVHLYGIPAPVQELALLCDVHGLHLVEDAAQAHGARHRQQQCGTFGIIGCFSFYPTKNLGALGDGGGIVTSDDELAKRMRRLRNYGSSVKYHIDEIGHNSRLDEMQAAFLRVKLHHLDEMNARRAALAQFYQQRLAGMEEIILPEGLPRDNPVWHLFPIMSADRAELQQHLSACGIQTAIHYPIPVYRMAPFQAYGPDQPTRSDKYAAEVLSLPFSPLMDESSADETCAAIRSFFDGR